jgi:hypothetical protein
VDDAAGSLRLHPGQYGAPEQHRALDEERELGEMVLPRHLGQRGLGLRARGVDHEHVDGTEAACHATHELGHLPLVGDVGRERVGDSAVVADCGHDLERLRPTAAVVDGHGEPITAEPHRDRAAQPARASRHESDALLRRRHGRDRTVPPLRPQGGIG